MCPASGRIIDLEALLDPRRHMVGRSLPRCSRNRDWIDPDLLVSKHQVHLSCDRWQRGTLRDRHADLIAHRIEGEPRCDPHVRRLQGNLQTVNDPWLVQGAVVAAQLLANIVLFEDEILGGKQSTGEVVHSRERLARGRRMSLRSVHGVLLDWISTSRISAITTDKSAGKPRPHRQPYGMSPRLHDVRIILRCTRNSHGIEWNPIKSPHEQGVLGILTQPSHPRDLVGGGSIDGDERLWQEGAAVQP
jgi:hypothetical protein